MKKKNLALTWMIIQILLTAALIPLTKYVFNQGVDPLNFSFQILLASFVYLFIGVVFKEVKVVRSLNWKSIFNIALIGIVSGAVAYGFGNIGLMSSSAINYAFLIQTTVFFTPVLAFFFLGEHLKKYKVVLITILLIGAYLISTNGKLILPQVGDLYILLGSVAFSTGVILTKKILKDVPVLTFSMFRSLFGGISLLMFLLVIGKVSLDFNWFWIAIIGMVIAAGVYSMNKVLEYGSASYMQMMYMSVPVITAILAFFISGETMTPVQIAGGIIIILSGYFVQKLDV